MSGGGGREEGGNAALEVVTENHISSFVASNLWIFSHSHSHSHSHSEDLFPAINLTFLLISSGDSPLDDFISSLTSPTHGTLLPVT